MLNIPRQAQEIIWLAKASIGYLRTVVILNLTGTDHNLDVRKYFAGTLRQRESVHPTRQFYVGKEDIDRVDRQKKHHNNRFIGILNFDDPETLFPKDFC